MKEIPSVVEDAVSSVKREQETNNPCQSVGSTEGILNAIMKTCAQLSVEEILREVNAKDTAKSQDAIEHQ